MAEELVAFNATDADGLLAILEAAGGESIASEKRFRPGIKWGMTTAAGIGANTTGECWLRTPTLTGWQNYTVLPEVFNEGEAIAANTLVLLIPIDGRWCVFDVCAGTT